ncbi:hypothetical protein CPB85DRAFT_1263577 [Mucidula mucida]|nr:hypothetical protein CPB85DRAFT_1263577 [Mucidula mucida]
MIAITCFHIIFVSLLWPGSLLRAAEAHVEEIKAYLMTKDNRRGTTTMAAIRTTGLKCLDDRAHKYICGVTELCKKARRCKSNIDALYEWSLKDIAISHLRYMDEGTVLRPANHFIFLLWYVHIYQDHGNPFAFNADSVRIRTNLDDRPFFLTVMSSVFLLNADIDSFYGSGRDDIIVLLAGFPRIISTQQYGCHCADFAKNEFLDLIRPFVMTQD